MCSISGCSPVMPMKRIVLRLIGWPLAIVLAEVLAMSVALAKHVWFIGCWLGLADATHEAGACTTQARPCTVSELLTGVLRQPPCTSAPAGAPACRGLQLAAP